MNNGNECTVKQNDQEGCWRRKIKIFTGNSNRPLAEKIAKHLDIDISNGGISTFEDGEIKCDIDIEEIMRGCDCFVIQSTSAPVNDNLMGLLIMIDALKRASAHSITAVIPYFGYARQDRKAKPHQPISAKLVADILTAAGVNRIMTMDLHAMQIQGFFDIPVDHLIGRPLLISALRPLVQQAPDKYVCLSPDHGSASRARDFAKKMLGPDENGNRKILPIAIANKLRPAPNVCIIDGIIGDVKDKHVILLDDMVDTAGTLCKAADEAAKEGALSVIAAATHGVLSSDAIDKINNSAISKLYLLDTIDIPHEKRERCPKIEVVSTAELFAEAIGAIRDNKSLNKLLDDFYSRTEIDFVEDIIYADESSR